MPYPGFLRRYIVAHPAHHGHATFDADALVVVLACLCILAMWAAVQSRSRCLTCGSWPVRCHCGGSRT